jgi:hypothetical protein
MISNSMHSCANNRQTFDTRFALKGLKFNYFNFSFVLREFTTTIQISPIHHSRGVRNFSSVRNKKKSKTQDKLKSRNKFLKFQFVDLEKL